MKSTGLSHTATTTMPAYDLYTLADLYPIYKRYIAERLAPRCRECSHYGPPVTLDGYFETHRALKRLMNENPLDPLADTSDEAYGAVCWVAARSVGIIDEKHHAKAFLPAVLSEADALQAIMRSVWPITISTDIFIPSHMEESPSTDQRYH